MGLSKSKRLEKTSYRYNNKLTDDCRKLPNPNKGVPFVTVRSAEEAGSIDKMWNFMNENRNHSEVVLHNQANVIDTKLTLRVLSRETDLIRHGIRFCFHNMSIFRQRIRPFHLQNLMESCSITMIIYKLPLGSGCEHFR